jgi:hypothetical protein
MQRLRLLAATRLFYCLMLLLCAKQSFAQASSPSAGPQSASAQSSPTYRVGLKSIVVPAPANLQEAGADYRVLFEHDAPDSNRLVAAFLPAEVIEKLPARQEDGLFRYAFLETLRQAEFTEIDEATYKQVEEAVAKQYGTSTDAPALDVKGFQDELNHKLKAEGGTREISLNKPVVLGTFFSKPNAIAIGMMLEVAAGEKHQKVIMVTTLMKVQNRLLYAMVYAKYTSDDSVTWARSISEQWADAILKSNP